MTWKLVKKIVTEFVVSYFSKGGVATPEEVKKVEDVVPAVLVPPVVVKREVPPPYLRFTLKCKSGTVFELFGGPYRNKPDSMVGIKVAEELPMKPLTVALVNIPDFSIPRNDEQVRKALDTALGVLLNGEPLYVGCLGGTGRTGLFFALLYRRMSWVLNYEAVTGTAAIKFIRGVYKPHAVETNEQVAYVREFRVDYEPVNLTEK